MIDVEFRIIAVEPPAEEPLDLARTYTVGVPAVPRIGEWVHIPNVMTGRVADVDWRIEERQAKARVSLVVTAR